MTEDETNELLGPILARGEKPPGEWRKNEVDGTTTWQGESSWRTRHGDAIVQWRLGRPVRALNARMADGTSIPMVETASAIDRVNWRRAEGDCYVHGVVEITPDAVVFQDGLRPRFEPVPQPEAGEPPNLEADMGRDAGFLRLVQNDGFAFAAFEWFKNRDFRRVGSDRRWHCSFRYAAGMIADMRDKGETYTDFYPFGGDHGPEDVEAVKAVIAGIGWHDLTMDERLADHAKAKDLVDMVSRRSQGPKPDWCGRMEPTDGTSLLSRMRDAAVAGQATEGEWHQFFEMYDEELDPLEEEEKISRFAKLFKGRSNEIDGPKMN